MNPALQKETQAVGCSHGSGCQDIQDLLEVPHTLATFPALLGTRPTQYAKPVAERVSDVELKLLGGMQHHRII